MPCNIMGTTFVYMNPWGHLRRNIGTDENPYVNEKDFSVI